MVSMSTLHFHLTIHLTLLFVGFIDVDEIMIAFKGLGVTVDRNEAEKLLKRYVNCIHPFPAGIVLVRPSADFRPFTTNFRPL